MKFFKWTLGIILLFLLCYIALGYLSSYMGWYGYGMWKNRIATSDIDESKKRGVFIKELHFRIDSFSGVIPNFRAYIERGFTYGRRSAEETVDLKNSNYPYQLCFNIQ